MKYDLYEKIAKQEGVTREFVKLHSFPVIYGIESNSKSFKGNTLEEKITEFIRFVKMIKIPDRDGDSR